ncbi:sister chromatid cohesion protein PDS5 homolog D-like [Solanum verrucosum]|uniref:sister chromatid cohesion protein PDS5 homolog D-like n=1 Tax=Solanum verrucosum TaxID=315347 RepID=UPI0020D161F4|nr:sister chromatid cohesion protein PDS5 homolog D-like [Solanum verrucosum]
MASSGSSCADWKKMEDEFTAYGMSLMNPPSSIDELFKLLQKVESLLKMVSQDPFDSTTSAIQPLMKALVRNELLGHTSEDVKVSVISCITEISRIYAPKYPYNDHRQMEEILRQTVMALKKLADVTSRSYRKVVRVLEIFTKVRLTAVVLDHENETLIFEIFKKFLEVIRPYHPHNIFTWMKEIMTRLIEGSGELSAELLRLLLDSLKIDNQMDSPVASHLVEEVLKDCAAIVKPYFAEALKSMSLNSGDYAETVALLCNEMPKGKEMMATENAPDTVHRVKVGPSEATCCEPARQDDTHREKLKHTCLTNIMKPVNPEDVHPTKNVPKENQERTGSHKLTGHPVKVGPSEAKFCEPVLQDDTHREKLKDTCTTNIIKPINPEDVQPATNVPKENQEGTGSHELSGSSGHHSLVSENHNNSTGSHGHFKRKEIPINDDDELVVLIPIGDVPQSQVQKKDSLHLDLTRGERTKRTVCAKRKRGSDSRKNESASDCDSERKSESSIKNEEGNLEEHKEPTLQQIFGTKQRQKKKKTTNTEESGDKDSERAHTSKDHGAELIGAKIKVWWPLEQVFYEGVISSFDSETNKHKVIYDDGEVEKLRLHKEQWELLEDNSSQKDSKKPCSIKDYGKELVGDRIKVWWPLDEMFYEGVISSFDSDTNKHEVVYDDGEVEKLRLHKERWKMLEDNSSQKDSKRTCTIKDYGKELVGARIKVWWPLDEKFYEGVVSSFDPVERKHKVLYDDGEAEKLRLHKERWEMLEDNSTQKDHGLDFQGHAVSSATS